MAAGALVLAAFGVAGGSITAREGTTPMNEQTSLTLWRDADDHDRWTWRAQMADGGIREAPRTYETKEEAETDAYRILGWGTPPPPPDPEDTVSYTYPEKRDG